MNLYNMMTSEKSRYIKRYKTIKNELSKLNKDENPADYYLKSGQLAEIEYSFELFFGKTEELQECSLGLIKLVTEMGFDKYICCSFAEAENNDRKKNIVIIDDSEIHLTYKMDDKFGEFVCWTDDEIKEDPEVINVIANYVKTIYSMSEYDLEKYNKNGFLSFSFKPYNSSTIEPSSIADKDDADDAFEYIAGCICVSNNKDIKFELYKSTTENDFFQFYDVLADSSITGSAKEIIEDLECCRYPELVIRTVGAYIS